MPKVKTNQEFLNEIKENYPYLKPNDVYVNRNTRISFFDSRCGHTYKATPAFIYRGCGCPICYKQPKDYNFYIEKIKSQNKNVNPIKIFIKNNRIYCEYECLICHKIFERRIDGFKSGNPCPTCTKSKSHDEFVKQFYKNSYNKNILITSKYRTSRDNMDFECLICKYKWRTLPKNVLRGIGCPNCNGYAKRTHDEFLKELSRYDNDIEILSPYDGVDNYVVAKHRKCNYIWNVRAGHLLEGCGCPVCNVNNSKGEEIISAYLKQNNIRFKIHHKYDGLVGVGNKNLSYDFYLDEYNLLIEFQGKQHESVAKFSQNVSNEDALIKFQTQQEHDRRKREYAKSHNIDLLEIWYYDIDNIEKILDKKLNIDSQKYKAS